MINITLGDKQFKVEEAASYKERRDGLQGVKELAPNEGMIFYYDRCSKRGTACIPP